MNPEDLRAISPGLRLKISPRARRLALRLDTGAGVMNLVVPKRFSMRKAVEFAGSHREWIHAQLSALPAPVPFVDGAVIPVFGRDRTIDISFSAQARATRVALEDEFLRVTTNKPDPAGRIARFLKDEARKTLTLLVREKATHIGKTVAEIQIRDTRSRWGSCGPDSRISLSWRLVFAPAAAMDYVVAHEVAHLVHMNHSRQFWAACAALCDDYAAGKKWMRRHGSELLRYGMPASGDIIDDVYYGS